MKDPATFTNADGAVFALNYFIHSLDKAMQHTILLFVAFLLLTCPGFSESGGAAWLRYARLDPVVASRYASLPAVLITLDHSTVSQSAQTELLLGIRGMLRQPCGSSRRPGGARYCCRDGGAIQTLDAGFHPPNDLKDDAYALISTQIQGQTRSLSRVQPIAPSCTGRL